MGTKKMFSKSSVISMIASMLLSIFVTVLAVLISVKLGFASNNSIINSMEKVGYYDMVYEEFIEKSESLIIPNGLSIEVFDGVFSKEQIRSDGNSYLTAELNSNVFKVNIERYEEKLKENIYNYVEKNQLQVDGEAEKVIGDISDEIIDYYVEMLRVPYASTIGVIFRTITKFFPFIFVAMSVFAVVAIWIIYMQNPYKKNRIFRYLAYATMSGAISTLVIPIYCMVTKFYERIQLRPEYVYKFIVQYIEDGLGILVTVGIVLLTVSVAMIILSTYIKHKYKQAHHKKKKEESEE